MNITKLTLRNFRNYKDLVIEDFSPKLNIIYGKNAQGKTNLLESINMCANGKSFRASSGFIKEGASHAYIKAEYQKNKSSGNVELLLSADKQKSIKVNGINKQFFKDLLGNIFVVSFCPEDIKTAKENPGLRRKFLDLEISKLRPVYVDALKNYQKLISEKNAVLRNFSEDKKNAMVDVYNTQLEPFIKIIVKNRKKYIEKLASHIQQIHNKISGTSEFIEIKYLYSIDETNILSTLTANKQKEKEEKKCNIGPHRDDILIKINGMDIKNYASQGQVRTAMLSIKIGCLKILKDTTGITPVFILDDVFSELDNTRKTNLMEVIKNIQTFISVADISKLDITGKMYEISGGAVVFSG